MSSQKQTKDNFIAQAGILAAAGIISRIIGLLYRGPLNSVIGELGLGYYQAAYGFYNIVLMLSSYSIPSAISKVIAQKLAVKEYRNAHRLFYCALGYVLVVGLIASSFLFFAAGLFVQKEAIPVLRTFAPTIFVFGVLGVLRGYFQAHKSMIQTSVSQILEQIANAAISVGGAYYLIKLGLGTVSMPEGGAEKIRHATLGAIGSAIGTGVGVLVALGVMFSFYMLNRKLILRRVARDRHEEVDTYLGMVKTITLVVTPFILSTAIYNLNDTVVNYLYTKLIPEIKELSSELQYEKWGIFNGQAMTVFRIPIAFATAMAAAMIPSVTLSATNGDFEEAKEKIASATKTTMLISMPAAVGLFALAQPVMYFLFPSKDEVVSRASGLLMALTVSIVFFALSTLSNSVLQGLGKMTVPIVNAGIALIVQVGITLALLLYTNLDCYGLAIGNVIYSAMMFLLNQFALWRAVGYRIDLKGCFLMPFLSSAIMGVFARGVYEILYLLTDSKRISLIPAILTAVLLYFVVLLVFRAVNEEELRAFPKGYLLVKAAKKVRLL